MIVDDERPAIRKLAHLLKTLDGFDITICGTYCSPTEAFENLGTSKSNLVFLDIEMPGMNGLEAAERMMALKPEVDVVFVTAYDKYALEAFEVNAVDYLLKPVVKERLAKTLSRINSNKKTPAGEEAAEKVFSVKAFGGLDIVKNGVPMNIKWRSAKVRELFGYYIHNRGIKLHRNKILEELWGDMEYDRALANFNTCNYQLRRQLAETGSGIQILFSGGYYTLELYGNTCDADLVENILSKKADISRSNIARITEAIELCEGLYCENIPGLWADSRRYYYENMYVNRSFSAANYFYEQKMFGECLAYAQKAVGKNRLFEEGWKLIFEVLKLRGDTAAYKEKLDSMRNIFEKELGFPPDFDC